MLLVPPAVTSRWVSSEAALVEDDDDRTLPKVLHFQRGRERDFVMIRGPELFGGERSVDSGISTHCSSNRTRRSADISLLWLSIEDDSVETFVESEVEEED